MALCQVNPHTLSRGIKPGGKEDPNLTHKRGVLTQGVGVKIFIGTRPKAPGAIPGGQVSHGDIIKIQSVFVAMSGGVDSSVAAYLLKKQGYNVTGVFMRSYNVDGCAKQDAEDARLVAEKIGIPFYVWDFENEYKKKVVEYMVNGYRRGETPNPDIMCNKEIKFGLFLKHALEMGADYIATGHYVRIKSIKYQVSSIKQYVPYEAKDKNKDQSYFLWTLTQNQLRHCLFPIGDYLKSEVRAIARRAGLPTAEKKDSQGICFLGKVTLADFLKKYIRGKKGEIIDISGNYIGEHDGVYFYTIGQRHGLNLKNKNSMLRVKGEHVTRPHYVTAKNVETNTLTVAEGVNNPELYRKEVVLADVNFITSQHHNIIKSAGTLKMKVLARVRYRQPVSAATLTRAKVGRYKPRRHGRGSDRSVGVESCKLIFNKPQKFVAAGQSAVFYSKKGEMLGGGVIV